MTSHVANLIDALKSLQSSAPVCCQLAPLFDSTCYPTCYPICNRQSAVGMPCRYSHVSGTLRVHALKSRMTEIKENSADKILDMDGCLGSRKRDLDSCASHLFPCSSSSGRVVDLRRYVAPSRIIAWFPYSVTFPAALRFILYL